MHRVQYWFFISLLFSSAASAQPTEPAPGGRPGASSNPDISLILNGRYAAFSQPVSGYRLPGFALGAEATPGQEGFRLGESEFVISSNVDDRFSGRFTVALTADNEVDIEEAYLETRKLGHGLTLRAGRFLSGIGYHNGIHAHAWSFVDAPLVYRAMLATAYGDDGVQLRWVAPLDIYLEIGAERFRGDGFPAGGGARAGNGVGTAFIRLGDDLGPSHAWRLGISQFHGRAESRESGDDTAPDRFTGSSRIQGVDLVWKWAPNGNARDRSLIVQFERFRREENGNFTPAGGSALAYTGDQSGHYLQTVYQFQPRWRLGLRVDRTEAGAVNAALAGTALDTQSHRPERRSAMVDFSNSEFSRLRLQFNRDNSRPGATDRQWFIQYITSLGAHGAHTF